MSKFCKICKDQGKPEHEYRSHNVRERGVVVCVTLINTTCRYCKQKGHTPKFCSKLKDRQVSLGLNYTNGNRRSGGVGQRRRMTGRAPPSCSSNTWQTTREEGRNTSRRAASVQLFVSKPKPASFAVLGVDSDDECDDDEEVHIGAIVKIPWKKRTGGWGSDSDDE